MLAAPVRTFTPDIIFCCIDKKTKPEIKPNAKTDLDGALCDDGAEFTANTNNHIADVRPQKVALRTVPVFWVHGTTRIEVNAFLDDGSTASYILEKI